MTSLMLRVLEETIDYYSIDSSKRSINDQVGEYNSVNGNHCAIGRCLREELIQLGTSLPGNGSDVLRLVVENGANHLDELLLPEYQGLPFIFWIDIQNLHDIDAYWCSNGLTSAGLEKSEKIKQRIKSSFYTVK